VGSNIIFAKLKQNTLSRSGLMALGNRTAASENTAAFSSPSFTIYLYQKF